MSNYKIKRLTKDKPQKCEVCSSKRYIHIHHKDHNRKNNIVQNLQLLCASCHRKLHAPFRKKSKYIKPNKQKEVTCFYCGVSFFLPPCRIKERNFCCRKHADLNKRNRVKKLCLYCGKTFETHKCYVERNQMGCCSFKCRSAYTYHISKNNPLLKLNHAT